MLLEIEIDDATGEIPSKPKYELETVFQSGTKAVAQARTLKAVFCMLRVTYSGDTSAIQQVTIRRLRQ